MILNFFEVIFVAAEFMNSWAQRNIMKCCKTWGVAINAEVSEDTLATNKTNKISTALVKYKS